MSGKRRQRPGDRVRRCCNSTPDSRQSISSFRSCCSARCPHHPSSTYRGNAFERFRATGGILARLHFHVGCMFITPPLKTESDRIFRYFDVLEFTPGQNVRRPLCHLLNSRLACNQRSSLNATHTLGVGVQKNILLPVPNYNVEVPGA